MKCFLRMTLLWAACTLALAQGTFRFTNYDPDRDVLAPVFHSASNERISDPKYRVQLYAAPYPAETLKPVGVPLAFMSGVMAGFFDGGVVVIDTVAPGSMANVQLRGWDATWAPTFEDAPPIARGSSVVFGLVTGGAGDPPSPPARLGSDGVFTFAIPEPSTLWLGLLAAVGLAFRRSRWFAG